MQSLRKVSGGTLTLKTDDGYVVEAPVEGFSVSYDADYADVYNDYGTHPFASFKTSESVTFTAYLKYGESYTVKDLGVDVDKTFTVKGNKVDITQTHRSALGVPIGATARYLPENDVTKFTWTERVIVDE